MSGSWLCQPTRPEPLILQRQRRARTLGRHHLKARLIAPLAPNGLIHAAWMRPLPNPHSFRARVRPRFRPVFAANMSSGFSRRGLFSLFARPLKASGETARAVGNAFAGTTPAEAPPAAPPVPMVAIIQGRHCLALESYCSVCIERCPEPGAMNTVQMIPMIVPEICTGCGICQQVCPAPENAVLMLPRRTSPAPPDA